MALWSIDGRPASVVGDSSTYVPGSSSQTTGNPVIVYPNQDGTTGGHSYNYNAPSPGNSYGGQPITINTGNSAEGLNTLSGTLGAGFEGLFNLIQQNTDKNNAWSAAQAQKQMDFQERMNNIAMEFNSLEAGKNRQWQEYMSSSAHQREVADLKAAGLNPILSASGGNGAAVGSGAQASGVTSAGAMGDTDESGSMALSSIYGALLSAQTQMYNANITAKTNLAIADKQAAASMYGAQLAAETARMNSPMQLYNALASGLGALLGGDKNSGKVGLTPSDKVVGLIEDAVSDPAIHDNTKMSYEDARAQLANSILGRVLRWNR